MIKIGDFEIHVINDVDTKVDGGGAFGLVPRVMWSKYFEYDDQNMIPMAQHCLYVKAHGKHIIVDTGLGERITPLVKRMWHISRYGGLRRGLASLGVTVDDIDLVINTHLHSDHCSGNTIWADDEQKQVKSMFPNAEYVVQKREFEEAIKPNERTRATYILENYVPLKENRQLRLLEGDTELLQGIKAVITPGHTPAHMSVVFESNGQYGLFLCDLATYMVHFERIGWMTAYDVEPLVTLETKRIWQQWALEHDAVLLSVHDPIRPVGKLIETSKGRVKIEPLDISVIKV